VEDADHARAWSLERKLPLLMTGVLTAMLALTLVVTYATLTRTATATAVERLQRAANELGTVAQASVAGQKARLVEVARDGAFRRALLMPASGPSQEPAGESSELAAARDALAPLLTRVDTGLTAELWSADGRRVAFVGRDRQGGDGSGREGREVGGLVPPPPGFDALQRSDSAQMSALSTVGDTSYFWVAAPVLNEGARIGYLARQYRIAAGRQAEQTIRALVGAEVTAYYRSAEGGQWTTISGAAASPPRVLDRSDAILEVSRPGVGELFAVERPIAGTPLVLALERSRHSVLAPPRATLRWLALASVVLLLVGAAASLFISRRITRPLVALTGAARAIAQGDYGTRVEPTGGEELARLAESFNRMAAEVGAARAQLERQTEEAQATAEQLDESNRELGVALHHLEEREAQFRALADAIPQLAWMAHADGTPFWYNERWYAYTGTTPEMMRGHEWRALHEPAMLPDVLERWRASITAGAPFEMEFPLRGADGRFRWFLTRGQPVRDGAGKVVRWFGTNTDVHALRDAREAAEAANRAKSEFLAVMSHELRTPLNAIGGYTELLELGLRGPVTEAQRRDLDRIRVSQQHLLGLISGVLDLSRIEAGRVSYDLVRLPLDAFLADLNSLVEPQAIAKSLTLVYAPCAPQLGVLADREKLRQILLNLLSNAIRYTPAGGRIVLAAAEHGEESVAIMVRDTGVGIPADALEQIFAPFVQLDRSLTQPRDGVGLGLAISLDLARGMGGEILVESQPGEGSRFVLTLPRAVLGDGEALRPSGEFPAARALTDSRG
jgi:PAS domain S-box-containing protein